MHIIFSPQRGALPLGASRDGDALTLNEEVVDFSALSEGETMTRDAIVCGWIAGDVTRTGGVLHIPLILPHGTSAPAETLFPDPVDVVGDGPVPLPPYEA